MNKKVLLVFSVVVCASLDLFCMENNGTLQSASGTTNSDVKTLSVLIAEAKKESFVVSEDITLLASLAHDGAGFLAQELRKLSIADNAQQMVGIKEGK
ncbi:hypothetical protein CVU75_03265 [Candidatus Dependentiae bacterium HGW-Dependentiae-1]|nr:MAG: hypothetical protein CVU75_03265 [Candidatus Dependentiae bacterium HGW-Dependentiae-1]